MSAQRAKNAAGGAVEVIVVVAMIVARSMRAYYLSSKGFLEKSRRR
jgi:hypothetical protein